MKKIILIHGKMRTGKSSLARFLQGYEELTLSKPVKDACKIIFNNTERQTLQVFGTDVMRQHNPNIWVDNLIRRINESKSEKIVVSDIRFLNEVTELKKAFKGDKVDFVVITRSPESMRDKDAKEVQEFGHHESEKGFKYNGKHHIFDNSGSMARLAIFATTLLRVQRNG